VCDSRLAYDAEFFLIINCMLQYDDMYQFLLQLLTTHNEDNRIFRHFEFILKLMSIQAQKEK